MDEVRATPGVVSASLAGQTPLDVNTWWAFRYHPDAPQLNVPLTNVRAKNPIEGNPE